MREAGRRRPKLPSKPRWPKRRDGWALWGLWQAEEKLGDAAAIAKAKAAFDEAWLGEPDLPALDRL